MATYESLIKINGAVGDLVFYTLNGKNVVRKKSGFNKTAFKKSPAYEKVRQNSSEFGHCSKIGKIIRQVLDQYIKQADEPLLYQKFAKLMTEIKDLDEVSERGKRTVENGIITEKGKLLLRKFQFGNKNNFDGENSVSLELLNEKLYLSNTFSANEAVLISLKIDFQNYLTKHFEEKILVGEKEKVSFTKQFSDDDLILYFIVLKKNEEILNMGFV